MNLQQIIFVEFKMYIALIFEKYRKASTFFVNRIRIKNIFEIGNVSCRVALWASWLGGKLSSILSMNV